MRVGSSEGRIQKMLKAIYFIVGWIALVFGAIGVILPVLPTTPFLLLAAFCFTKSSKKFHQWFIHTKLYQNHLDTFIQSRSMTLKTKIRLLSFASSVLLIAFISLDSIHFRIFIIILVLIKYYYFIFRIKTIPNKKYA